MSISPQITPMWENGLSYTPQDHGVGIIHIGAGAFHRAHQAVYTDDVLATAGGDWRILGVSLRSVETAQALNAQSGQYHVVIRAAGADRPEYRVIGALAGVLTTTDGIAPILDAMINAQVHIVSLTITEKAYGLDRATGGLNRSDPMIAADLKTPNTPRTAIGLIVRALQLRRQNGLPAFTAMSCDNLPDNGKLLKAAVLGFAQDIDPDLATWIAENARFPSTMVDRITPACTPALIAQTQAETGLADQAPIETEPFSQWVIEDDFSTDRPAWEIAGALLVSDVAPYEKMKLRMLNGAHSLLAYAGFLSGCTYVRDVMADPALSALVARHIKAAAKTLEPLEGIDFDAYGRALLARFRNPNIAHETYQIAMDGSQKLPQRIFEPAALALVEGHSIETYAFCTAAWVRYLLGQHETGVSYALRDPREAELSDICKTHKDDAAGLVSAIFSLPNLVAPDLAKNPNFRGAVQNHLSLKLTKGIGAATANVLGGLNV